MSKLFIVLGLFCILQTSYARSVRDAPAPEESILPAINAGDLLKQADDAVKVLTDQFLSLWGAKDTDELSVIIRNQTTQLATQFETRVSELTNAAKDSKANELVKEFTDKITAQVDEWKKENPETAESATKLRDTLEAGLKSVTAQGQVFSSKVTEQGVEVNEGVQKLLKDLYGDLSAAAKSLSEKANAVSDKKE